MKYFNDIEKVEEVKKEYRRLAKILHPDVGGDKEDFQLLQNEYLQKLKTLDNNIFDGYKYTYNSEVEKGLMEKINELIKFHSLEVYLVGRWIWVGGETKTHKELLKKLNFRWNSFKKLWYFAGVKSKGFGNTDFSDISEKYGMTLYKNKNILSK